jgi:hypothetical protein
MIRRVSLALGCAVAVGGFAVAARAAGETTNQVDRGRGGPQSAEDRAVTEERLNSTWNSMPVEEKMRVMRLHRGLRVLPPEERRAINERIDHFLNLSPQEQQKLQQNYQRWQQMTPEQRQRAREEFNKRRKDFEERWRREHPGEQPPPFLPRRGGPPNRPAPPPFEQPPHEREQPISPAPQAE